MGFFNCGLVFAAAVEKGVYCEELLSKYAGGICNIASNDIGKLP